MAKKKVDKQPEMKNFNMLTHFTVKEMSNGEEENEIVRIAGTANFMGAVDDQGYGTYLDLSNEVVQIPGIDVKTWKANPIILFGHDRDKPIGKGTKIEKQKDRLYIEAEIHKGSCSDEIYYAIKNGILSTFSIGFKSLSCDYREVNGTYIRYVMKSLLVECSIVSIPCNSASSFQVTKAYGEDGFYVEGDEDDNTNDYHGEVNIDEEESTQKGDNTMKIQVKDLLEPEKVAELEALGLKTELEQEKEIDIKTYIDSLVDKKFAKFKEEISKKEVEVPEVKTEEEKEAEELAAKESQEKEAEELAAKEVEEAEFKSLSDVIAELKKLTTDEEI